MGKALKKASKSLKKAAKKVSKNISSVGKNIGKAVGSITKSTKEIVNKISKEAQRIVDNTVQVVKVLSGEYHRDVKKVEDYQKRVEAYGDKVADKAKYYNYEVDKLADRMNSLIAFHEIFQMALGNKLDVLSNEYSSELAALNKKYESMVAELKRMVAKIESEYDFVIGLTQGAFIQRIIGSIIMIVGGLMSDLGDVLSGKADSSTWGRIGMSLLMIVLIVLAILFPPAWAVVAATGALTTTYMIVIGLMVLSAFLTLDGMYANGAATGAIMGVLDGIFNDILNLDDLIGSDFDKFDKDHEDYSQMVGYVQLAIALTTVYLAWSSSSAYYAAEAEVARQAALAAGGTVAPEVSALGLQTSTPGFMDTAVVGQSSGGSATNSYLGGAVEIGTSASDSTMFGVTFSTYSDIYDAFSAAIKVKDYITANKQYGDMKKKLEEDREKVSMAIDSKLNKNMMKHYKDTAYFLQDQQDQIDNYIWSMTAANMYVDPYGTTPVANIRFTPDQDTRGLSFGFEDMFDESMMAGSKSYFNSIIYGS